MLRDEARAIVQRGLGFRDDQADAIVDAMKQAQRLLELGRTLPDFLKEEDATLSVPSGSADVAWPTGFIREVDRETFHYNDATAGRVWLEKFEDLNLLRSSLATVDTTAGKPKGYYVRKGSFVILPQRDTTYSLTYSYYKQATVLTTNVENSWLLYAPDVLVGRTGMLVTEDLGASDPGMARRYEKFKMLYVEAWSGLFADGELRREAGPLVARMGGRA